MAKKEKYPIYVTIYRRRANKYALAFDKAKVVARNDLKFVELEKEKATDGSPRRLVVANPNQVNFPREVFANAVDDINRTPAERQQVEQIAQTIQTGKERKIIKFFDKIKIPLSKFKPTTEIEQQFSVTTKVFQPLTIQGLGKDELERAYKSSVFETLEDGSEHIYLMQLDTSNWCFLVPVIDGQQLELVPVLSEEQVKFYTDVIKDTIVNYGKKLSWLDKNPWFWPAILVLGTLLITLWIVYAKSPDFLDRVLEVASTRLVKTCDELGTCKVYTNLTDFSDRLAKEVIKKVALNQTATWSQLPPNFPVN